MSKRNVALLALTILFVLSVTAFAVSTPTSAALSASGGVAPLAAFKLRAVPYGVYHPQCPPSAPPGCGGG